MTPPLSPKTLYDLIDRADKYAAAEVRKNAVPKPAAKSRLDRDLLSFKSLAGELIAKLGLYSKLGSEFYNGGHFNDAIAAYKKAIESNPNDAVVQFNLGCALKKKCRFDEAAVHFKKAVELDPQSFFAYYKLGCVLETQGRLDEAASAYNAAIKLRPNFDAAWNRSIRLGYKTKQK